MQGKIGEQRIGRQGPQQQCNSTWYRAVLCGEGQWWERIGERRIGRGGADREGLISLHCTSVPASATTERGYERGNDKCTSVPSQCFLAHVTTSIYVL